MIKRGDKRAQEMSINTVILIVLGLAVLVLLIVGFTIGWDRIVPFIGSNNVDNVIQACNTACLTGSPYNYCFSPRDLNTDDEDYKDVTCYYLAQKMTNFGFDTCQNSAINCGENIEFNESSIGEVVNGEVKNKNNNCEVGKTYFWMNDKILESAKCVASTNGQGDNSE